MKRETLITAIVFLGVGFLAGYVFNAQRTSRQQAASVAATSPSSPTSTAAAQADPGNSDASGLPKGHPPVNDAEIIKFFKEAASRNPSDPEPRLKLANFLYDKHEFSDAITWYQQALRLDPRNVDARTDMATCYFNLGKAREALNELHQALKIDPQHEATLFNLIVVNLNGTHDLRAARQALHRLDQINPSYPNLDQLKQSLDQAAGGAPGKAASP
ncbi:MAG TPA: tetratricopeptide repeat protein [Terriglobia bacterium]|nr:tetratricopeptide repeat protein [Terriglobia bacterium]